MSLGSKRKIRKALTSALIRNMEDFLQKIQTHPMEEDDLVLKEEKKTSVLTREKCQN